MAGTGSIGARPDGLTFSMYFQMVIVFGLIGTQNARE